MPAQWRRYNYGGILVIVKRSEPRNALHQERKHRMISFQVLQRLTGYHSEPEYLKT